ncbi:MAG: GspH/FimT family pseudopilin [Pseudomonadaceae bacterium]|nr:GspH/FimT family pseudopilin [Pseudomonadaceae bacterium]
MRQSNQKSNGFTIIELLVALTIAAVMMAFALPAFNDFTVQRQMTANVNQFISAISYARSEATRLGGDVSLQAEDASDDENEWGPGFCVTAGDPGDCNNPLRVFRLEGTVTLNAEGVMDDEPTMTFNSRGLLQDDLAGTIELCGVDADDDPGRLVTINALGRANVERDVCFP